MFQENSLSGMSSLKDMAQHAANTAGLQVQQDAQQQQQQQQQDLSAQSLASSKSMVYNPPSAPASVSGVLPQLSSSSTMAGGAPSGEVLTSSASSTSLAPPEQSLSIQINPLISVSPLGVVPYTKEQQRQQCKHYCDVTVVT